MFTAKKAAKINAHGEERTRKHIVDNGRAEYFRREKYCVIHGWIDVLAVGGDPAWHRRHALCDRAIFRTMLRTIVKNGEIPAIGGKCFAL